MALLYTVHFIYTSGQTSDLALAGHTAAAAAAVPIQLWI